MMRSPNRLHRTSRLRLSCMLGITCAGWVSRNVRRRSHVCGDNVTLSWRRDFF